MPAGLVCDLEVKGWLERKLAHQPCGHKILLAEIVVEAGSAVATEVARRELTLIPLHQVLAFGDPKVFLRHHHACEARTCPSLTASAVTVAQRLGLVKLILNAATQASSLERFSHDGLSSSLP